MHALRLIFCWIPLFGVMGGVCVSLAAEQKDKKVVSFARDIQPIFQAHCHMCHGRQFQMNNLRLDRKAAALRGGDSRKPAIVPGDSQASLLIRYVSGADPEIRMPPSGDPLPSNKVELLREWINQGASWPEESGAEADSGARSSHWAFQPRRRVASPAVKKIGWVRNPIDNFVLAKLEERGWQPSSPAEPRAILRRVYFDLIGLPPLLPEQERFLKDPSPQSLDRLINNLLSRSSYGERWGRYWLDWVRYADTNGYERDAVKPEVWRYRDYVIRVFNDDKPFDRFVVEQLAGDELGEVTAQTLVATGFYRLGPWDDQPADPQQDRFDQLDDIVRTTSEVFLGLTIGCARCHDHKFDPVTSKDYYSMVAIFNGLKRPHRGFHEFTLPIGIHEELEREAARDRQLEPLKEKIEELKAPFRREFLLSGKSKLPPMAVEALLVDPAKRTVVQMARADPYSEQLEKEIREAMPEELKQRMEPYEQRIRGLKEETPDLPRGYFLQETDCKPPKTQLLKRGSAASPGQEVPPAVPVVLTDEQPEFVPTEYTSGRRLAFARWLIDPDNPLTARVIVNRVWQFHFGEGLVRTPSNFGLIGERPTHPELLDWLANWFIQEGWSVKKLHRLIMGSNTYRMSKRWNAEYGQEDPENRWLWRVEPRRLDVEMIRDAMLAVSGRLNRKRYGPSIYPEMPEAVLKVSKEPEKAWKPFHEEAASRRTIYAHVKRSMILPMLEVLDFCDTTRSSAKRMVTSVAPQALTLFNSKFVNRQARYFAGRLVNEVGYDAEKQVQRAYLLAFSRPPTERERQAMIRFMEEETKNFTRQLVGDNTFLDHDTAQLKALKEVCRVIFNLNEFVYTD